MSWFGGLAGGLLAGGALMRRRHLAVLPLLAAATPALAIGHLIGRIGCFLVGDDYGRPSNLPWAVAFPEGLPPTTVPVHPTQIYEAIVLVPIAAALIAWRRGQRPDRFVLGWYLLLTGSLRFAIEFVRVNERVVGALTVAHLASLAVAAAGIGLLVSAPRSGTSVLYKDKSMPKLPRRIALLALAVIVTGGVARAHDFWLVPDMFAVPASGEIVVKGQTSSAFPTTLSAVTPDRVTEAR